MPKSTYSTGPVSRKVIEDEALVGTLTVYPNEKSWWFSLGNQKVGGPFKTAGQADFAACEWAGNQGWSVGKAVRISASGAPRRKHGN